MDTNTPESDPPADRIQALARGLRVLECVHAAGHPISVKEIAAGVGLRLATTYHLVNTLLYDGYLRRNDDRLLEPGRLPGRPEPQSTAVVRRALGRAAYAIDDVAVLARRAGAETRVAATAEVPGAACAGHYPPNAAGLSHLLAVGRVILAHETHGHAEHATELTRRLASERHEVFDEAELRDSLVEVAQRGHCTLVGDGDACVAAPIFDADRTVFGAIAVVVVPRRLHRAHDRLVAVTTTAAREITAALGGARPRPDDPAGSPSRRLPGPLEI
jgi:DNA-binding IclR family transcriptional regulator